MFSPYWLTWNVNERRRQEAIDWALGQQLAETAHRASDVRGGRSVWQVAMLSIARGRSWVFGPSAMTLAAETSPQLTASEGFGAC
jgi:hypothetical protein